MVCRLQYNSVAMSQHYSDIYLGRRSFSSKVYYTNLHKFLTVHLQQPYSDFPSLLLSSPPLLTRKGKRSVPHFQSRCQIFTYDTLYRMNHMPIVSGHAKRLSVQIGGYNVCCKCLFNIRNHTSTEKGIAHLISHPSEYTNKCITM